MPAMPVQNARAKRLEKLTGKSSNQLCDMLAEWNATL
jgi:hypothetical protein